jgi:hypothetical protein
MAISQNPITGRMRQKMSNVVFSTVFSQNVVRSKPLTVRNPRTTGQVNHRDYFTKVVQLCKILKTDEGVAKRSSRTGRNPKMSAYSYLIKAFMNAEDRTSTPYKPIWSNVDIGPGDIGLTPLSYKIENNGLEISWDDSFLPTNGATTDALRLIVIDWETMEYHIIPTAAIRQNGQGLVCLEDRFTHTDTPKGVIAFFISADKSKWSFEDPALVTP